ncbi:molybdenum cofactor biosynthesis prote [Trametes versicolor FP-101664 SS1]|uniref:molybdenum cofactor biosynthesis prote n=1 Tax=Trametes versicolor (strain FP-101664) TaxID=717944 RepID=UPI0004623D51|nr:molybdenum cofactor biosynthesis prote [Trametes versicolor FP-101664 SS1]EIW63990.1 molybdenum cofactor biosynthesis prote [Trametes versicolor FP-101664 SS1]
MIRQAAVSSQAPLKPVSRNLSTSAVLRHAEVLPELASSASGLRNRIKHRISRVDAERGPSVSPFLVDSFARRHNYLRISLTERCNLRCFYCMPSEGIELSPPEHILSDDEVIRLATLFVKSGVTKIRLTGGEPMVRKGIVDIVGRLHGLRKHGLQSIGMTTNGIALHRKLPALVANGLTHLNISLDTLDPFKFEIMTRRMGHDAVLRSLQTALASRELQSVKLNVVVVKGLNDHEVPDFVEMTKESRLSVRFIEFMPFTGNKWDKAKMLPSSELLARIRERYPAVRKAPDELNDTARSYIIPGHAGSFGFISSMSDHFCGSCNRLRLTADGQIKVCLFDAKEISLRDEMRAGSSDDMLLSTIGRAVSGKKEKHAGMEDIDVVTNRPMILIGASCTPRLTHIDDSGRASMVNVAHKDPTSRVATASGRITIPKIAYELVTGVPEQRDGDDLHGDVLTVAQLAAIMGCKRTADLIPLCHPLQLSHIAVTLHPEVENAYTPAPAPRPDPDALTDTAQGFAHTSRSDTGLGDGARLVRAYSIVCRATVSCEGKTGVEMEALTAVSVGLLTVWDMLKAVAGREMAIGEIMVTSKDGGAGGSFVRTRA